MSLDTIDIAVRPRGRRPEVQVWRAPWGSRPVCRFTLPWTPEATLDLLAAVEERIRASVLAASGGSPAASGTFPPPEPRELGETLFQALFGDDVQKLLDAQLARLGERP